MSLGASVQLDRPKGVNEQRNALGFPSPTDPDRAHGELITTSKQEACWVENATVDSHDDSSAFGLEPYTAEVDDSLVPMPWEARPLSPPQSPSISVCEKPEDGRTSTHRSMQQLLRLCKKVHSLRSELGGTRSDIAYQKEKIVHAERHAQESGNAFMMASNQASVDGFSDTSRNQLNSLHEESQADFDTLGLKRDGMNAKDNLSSEQEFRLYKQETRLMNISEAFPEGLHDIHSAGWEAESQPPTPPSLASEDVPSLSREYYDRAGDVGVLEQRINDQVYQYEEESAERQTRIERGLPVDPPEDAFEQAFNYQSKMMFEHSEAARADAKRLRRVCLEAGLKPEGDEDNESSVSSRSPNDNRDYVWVDPPKSLMTQRFPSFYHQADTDVHTVHFPSAPAIVGDNLVTQFKSTRDRINRWILDVLRHSALEVLQYKAAAKPVEEEKQYHLPVSESEFAEVVREHWRKDEGAVGRALTPMPDEETGLRFHDTHPEGNSHESIESAHDHSNFEADSNLRPEKELPDSGPTNDVSVLEKQNHSPLAIL